MAARVKPKTHKGLKKRVRVSANGKVRHRKAFTGHLFSGKPGRKLQSLRRKGEITTRIADKIKLALGV